MYSTAAEGGPSPPPSVSERSRRPLSNEEICRRGKWCLLVCSVAAPHARSLTAAGLGRPRLAYYRSNIQKPPWTPGRLATKTTRGSNVSGSGQEQNRMRSNTKAAISCHEPLTLKAYRLSTLKFKLTPLASK